MLEIEIMGRYAQNIYSGQKYVTNIFHLLFPWSIGEYKISLTDADANYAIYLVATQSLDGSFLIFNIMLFMLITSYLKTSFSSVLYFIFKKR